MQGQGQFVAGFYLMLDSNGVVTSAKCLLLNFWQKLESLAVSPYSELQIKMCLLRIESKAIFRWPSVRPMLQFWGGVSAWD